MRPKDCSLCAKMKKNRKVAPCKGQCLHSFGRNLLSDNWRGCLGGELNKLAQ